MSHLNANYRERMNSEWKLTHAYLPDVEGVYAEMRPFNVKPSDELPPDWDVVVRVGIPRPHGLTRWFLTTTNHESYPEAKAVLEARFRIAVVAFEKGRAVAFETSGVHRLAKLSGRSAKSMWEEVG